MNATEKPGQPLHRRPMVHGGFWAVYVLYRSLIRGVWQGYEEQWIVLFLDLPLKIALAYALVHGVARPLLAGRWRRAAWLLVGCSLVATLLRQALWHAIILPQFYPQMVDHPGFFDPADLAGNSASLFPVALVLSFLWIVLELTHTVRKSPTPKGTDDDVVVLQIGARTERLPIGEIIFIRSDGDYCRIQLKNRELRVHRPLKRLLRDLPESFVRIHRQHVINPTHVTATTGQQVRIFDQWLPVGRTYRKALEAPELNSNPASPQA